jgi:hypothetical protein
MMNNIIRSKYTAILLSWGITLGLVGMVARELTKDVDKNAFQQLPHASNKDNLKPGQRSPILSEEQKEKQRIKPLPSQYANQIAGKAEEKSTLELKNELMRFEQMHASIQKQTTSLLGRVRSRKLSAGVPRDANNVGVVKRRKNLSTSNLGAEPTAKAIYEMLRQYESEIQLEHLAVSAAKKALAEGLSFPDVYRALSEASSKMPSFDQLVNEQLSGTNGQFGNAKSGIDIHTTTGLKYYRATLGQATRQASLARTRLSSYFGNGRNATGMGNGGVAGSGAEGKGNGAPGGGDGKEMVVVVGADQDTGKGVVWAMQEMELAMGADLENHL